MTAARQSDDGTHGTETSAFDATAIWELFNGDISRVRELSSMLQRDLPMAAGAAREALAARDWTTLGRCANRLKSSAATLKVPSLWSMADDLAAAGRDLDAEAASAVLDRLVPAVDAVVRTLETWAASLVTVQQHRAS